jgi:hypothetical protein
MRRCPKALLCSVALLGLLFMSSPAPADSLTPGSTLTGALTTFNIALFAPVAGGDTGNVAFTAQNAQFQTTATGFVREMVGHYNGSANLAFLYQFSVTPGGIGGVSRLAVSNYGTFLTSVFQSALGGTRQQNSVDRSVSGAVIGANYDPEVSGSTVFALLIDTNAPNFQPGSIGLLDAGTADIAGFAPTVNTPEPASMMIFSASLLGLGGINLSRRFRARKALA